MRGPLSETAQLYNYIEIGIWCTIAVVVTTSSLRTTGHARRRGFLASLTLVAFGISDYAEIRTGGEWWRPWWLLAWKGACVVTLLALLVTSKRK